MSSSFRLLQRRKQQNIFGQKTWYVGDPGRPLGGDEDHYIRSFGDCVPGFEAYPIGNPEGVKLCVRRQGSSGCYLGDKLQVDNPHPSDYNGYNKYQADLYDPRKKTEVQMYNPQRYGDRRTPFEPEFIQKDYLRLPIKFNGTGLNPTKTPNTDGYKYYEYAYDRSPPPPKYDVTRGIQPYPIWKARNEYHYGDQSLVDSLNNDSSSPIS
jgi:hypothetical protein